MSSTNLIIVDLPIKHGDFPVRYVGLLVISLFWLQSRSTGSTGHNSIAILARLNIKNAFQWELSQEQSIFWFVKWRFPEMGVPPNHQSS